MHQEHSQMNHSGFFGAVQTHADSLIWISFLSPHACLQICCLPQPSVYPNNCLSIVVNDMRFLISMMLYANKEPGSVI